MAANFDKSASVRFVKIFRPRVHAQRKFAQGQGLFPSSLSGSPVKKPTNGAASSGSSTASGPTTKKKIEPLQKKGECPKTEDFLTFLCLRGTNLCPPEFDIFNRATIPPSRSSGDEDSVDEQVQKPQKRRKVVQQPQKLPESLKALKKKYTEQRIVRSVISQKAKESSKLNQIKSQNTLVRRKMVTRNKTEASQNKAPTSSGLRRGLRSGRLTRASVKPLRSVQSTIKKPSAASIIAKQKRRMATLNAASKNSSQLSSRMLTRLTPRGTSSAAFVRKAKKMPMEGKSLRGRKIDVSSEEEESEEENTGGYKGRKMVCRKTASNVHRSDSDESEDEEENQEESEDQDEDKPLKKTEKRPVRKTKEAATVYLNMLGQKLTKKSKEDDEISVKSLSESTQGKRLEQVEMKHKVKYKEKKIITPCIMKKKKGSESEEIKDSDLKKVSSKNKDKVKTKNLLKEVQDRLLEEAKKKIQSTPEAAPLINANNQEEIKEEERITISQRTGYIQVKSRPSIEGQDETLNRSTPTNIGPQRRLSNHSSTPPRKILPKETPETTPQVQPQQGHIPVGVVGAALSSSRPINPLKELPSTTVNGSTPPPAVPLSQPLLINTSINPHQIHPGPMVTQMQMHPQQGNIISAIRMPTIIRPNTQGVPIIMPQIALPNGSILQPANVMARPPYAPIVTSYGMQHPQNVGPPTIGMTMMPPMMPLTSSAPMTSTVNTSKCNTDVTITNTQPLVSPGPPLLSPQFQNMSAPTKPMDIRPPPPCRLPAPVLTPSSLPVTSGAVIRSVLPNVKGKTQFSRMPSATQQVTNSSTRATVSSNVDSKTNQKVVQPKQDHPKPSASSFKVDGESSPYAFEPEPLEIRPSVPYRKKDSKPTTDPPKAKMPKIEDFNLKDLNSSISLPAELATQLAAQAQAERGSGNSNETTYFIPLQSNSSGESFGVAVKLATEGPPGPDQKVIMKAKLVTQPTGKPTGATVISAPPGMTAKSTKKTTEKATPAKKKTKIVQQEKRHSSSSSSSSEEESSDEEPIKKSKKKLQQPSPSSSSSSEKTPPRKKKKEATVVALPVTSPTISSRSQQTCLGTVEAMDKFPKLGQHAHLIEAPVFKPTQSEFKDPIKYIQAIRKIAEPFGMCKIIPPASFKPECNVDDDMRFTAYNQYVHKLMNRWGPNSKEMAAIKKYLETQNVTINNSNHPMVSGVEIDLPALYHAVQSLGGLTEVIQKKKWGKIAEFLRVPKGTQDRSNKFYDIYCKFLLPYDTLSKVEREELFKLVEEEFEERQNKDEKEVESDEEEDESEEDDECVLKGKSTSLSAFFRVAKNLMSMVFKDKFANNEPETQPDLKEVEEEYWRFVTERDCHVQVQQGSIDTGSGSDGYGFPTSRHSSCGRHPWNLKILSNNKRSLLRTMGPVMGVTVPTLHIGMLFTTGCWYRDPHGLPWIEYHHTGAPKVWFGVPDSHSIAFYTAMKQLSPNFCRKKKIWLPQDTVMMPPNLLVKHGVSVSRSIQEAGQFMVVFPKAYTSNLCTGYTVSESVYFATREYLKLAEGEFENIRESKDPMLFPMPKLLLCIAKDDKSNGKTLKMIKPLLEKMRDNEYVKRTMISDLGVKSTERINLRSGSKKQQEEDEYECETCSANLYVSFVSPSRFFRA